MKLILSLLLVCLFCFDTYSQASQPDTLKRVETSSKFSYGEIERKNVKNLSQEEKSDIEERIRRVESLIQSIEIKKQLILENPEQKVIAEKEGWFKDMDLQLDELREGKKSLLELVQQ